MKITIKRVETKTVSEQWILRKLMWDGSPEPPDTETDQAINGEDVISLIESDEDLKNSVQRYARSALEARVAELTAENERLRQGGEAVARRLTAENDKLRRARADVDALLVAAEERLAEVERERDSAIDCGPDNVCGTVGHQCQKCLRMMFHREVAHVDSLRAQVEAMTKVVDACVAESIAAEEEDAARPANTVAAARKRGRAELAREDAVDAYRSATASAKGTGKLPCICSTCVCVCGAEEPSRPDADRTVIASAKTLNDRRPLPPDVLVCGSPETVHREVGEARAARSVKIGAAKECPSIHAGRQCSKEAGHAGWHRDERGVHSIQWDALVASHSATASAKVPTTAGEPTPASGRVSVTIDGQKVDLPHIKAAEPSRSELPAVLPHETVTCPECGPGIRIDEDGCCATCGADATVGPSRVEMPPGLFAAVAAEINGEPSRSDDGKGDEGVAVDGNTLPDDERESRVRRYERDYGASRLLASYIVQTEDTKQRLADLHERAIATIEALLPPGPGTVVERVRAVADDYAARVALEKWEREDTEKRWVYWTVVPGKLVADDGAIHKTWCAASPVALARAMGLVKGTGK